jgi:hypothetical protein
VLADLKVVLQQSASKVQDQVSNEQVAHEEIREQRRRKRKPSEGKENAKKVVTPTAWVSDPHIRPEADVPTRNFFAPLRSNEMEAAEETGERSNTPLRKSEEPAGAK